jgi:hypothetical protein
MGPKILGMKKPNVSRVKDRKIQKTEGILILLPVPKESPITQLFLPYRTSSLTFFLQKILKGFDDGV